MRVGELDAELMQPVAVAFDMFKLGKSRRCDTRRLSVGMHLSSGGEVFVIGSVELVEQVEFARAGMLRDLLVQPEVQLHHLPLGIESRSRDCAGRCSGA